VEVSAPGWLPARVRVAAAGGETRRDLRLVPEERPDDGAVVSGRVMRPGAAGDVPAEGAEVLVQRADSVVGRDRTGAGGAFAVGGLPAVDLRLDGREIKSGGSANAEIEVATHTGVVVPSQSVVDRDVDTLPFDVIEGSDVVDRSKQVIRVVYRVIDNKAVATPVRIGASDSTHTLVEAGLEPGDMVITGPYKVLDTIEHGERVLDVRRKRNEAAGAGEDGAEPDAGGGGEASP